MTKSKVLSVVLAGALVASMGAIAASATVDLSSDSIGIAGAYNNWGNADEAGNVQKDNVMTDDDGDGIFEGEFVVVDAETGLEFKVRANNAWDDSWGVADEDGLTWNSQVNLKAEGANAGDTVKVKFDTTGGDDLEYAVSFEIVPAATEPSTEEPSTEEPSTEEPSTDAPATGDATSAYALVGVVVAALGVAVVMTKKASVK